MTGPRLEPLSEREAVLKLAVLVAEIVQRCHEALGTDDVRRISAECYVIASDLSPEVSS